MSHSPGPWKAKKTAGGEWWVLAPNDPGDHEFQDDYEPILEASGVGYNFEADAKLAAAAPELLEVCKMIVNVYENADRAPGTLNAAYHAIAKAEKGSE